MTEGLFPEWVNEAIAEAADPTEGYFIEKIRQRELTTALGQVTCDGDHSEMNHPECREWPPPCGKCWDACPSCGAAI